MFSSVAALITAGNSAWSAAMSSVGSCTAHWRLVRVGHRVQETVGADGLVRQQERGGLLHHRVVLLQERQAAGVLVLLPDPQRDLGAAGDVLGVVARAGRRGAGGVLGVVPAVVVAVAVEPHRLRHARARLAAHLRAGPRLDGRQVVEVHAEDRQVVAEVARRHVRGDLPAQVPQPVPGRVPVLLVLVIGEHVRRPRPGCPGTPRSSWRRPRRTGTGCAGSPCTAPTRQKSSPGSGRCRPSSRSTTTTGSPAARTSSRWCRRRSGSTRLTSRCRRSTWATR